MKAWDSVSQSTPQVNYEATVESYVVRHLRELQGTDMTIQTQRSIVDGTLSMVHYDCVIVTKEGREFVDRNQQIIWFTRSEGN